MEGVVPAGTYVELDVDKINEGAFRERIEELLRTGLKDYLRWEHAMDRKDGSFTVSAKINVSRVANSESHFAVKADVNLKTPVVQRTSLVKGAGGVLLCQPEGSSGDDPAQIRLFDGLGRPKGVVNKETGELIDEDSSIVGRVEASG